jgi:hypothetical protein
MILSLARPVSRAAHAPAALMGIWGKFYADSILGATFTVPGWRARRFRGGGHFLG